MTGLTPHAHSNQRYWTTQAADYAAPGRRHWTEEPHWGIWEIPEAELRVLPDVNGLDVVELGCGTAYWSAWLARRGARPVGVDLTEAQLATARELQAEHGLDFPLLHASAEAVPLPDASFDLAFSEYGASLWCEPALWLAEAARLLRRGGRLIFLTHSPLLMLCTPPSGERASERLERDQFGMHRFEWPGEEGIEFHLPHGEMIRVLGEHGFAVEALHELQRPDGARDTRYDFVTPEWSRRWPCEEIWRARLVGDPGVGLGGERPDVLR
jgi:SAM-dependent methyltransferase